MGGRPSFYGSAPQSSYPASGASTPYGSTAYGSAHGSPYGGGGAGGGAFIPGAAAPSSSLPHTPSSHSMSRRSMRPSGSSEDRAGHGTPGGGAGAADSSGAATPAAGGVPDKPFFDVVTSRGVKAVKYRGGVFSRSGQKLVWLDMSNPKQPHLRWNDGDAIDVDYAKSVNVFKVKSIATGLGTDKARSKARPEDAPRIACLLYGVTHSDGSEDIESLDFLFESQALRDWFFAGFNAFLAAFAAALQQKVPHTQIVDFVRHKMLADMAPKATPRH
jgi:hypothetical protein